MTIDTAKELQMNIAKEGLALLVLHPTADVQLHESASPTLERHGTSPLVTHRRSSHSWTASWMPSTPQKKMAR